MHPALSRTDHRPWPLPAGPWVGRQSWRDLLFVHWPIDAAALRPLVPAGLAIQEKEGTSWIGVVPFRMADVMLRGLPALPWISAFPELNVRLYVERDGRPGVWFLSLDATNPIAVWTARRFVHLPYHRAAIETAHDGPAVEYRAVRRADPRVRFAARYEPRSPVYETTSGSLDRWLTERYCLYAQAPTGALYRTEIHHRPWPLQTAAAEIRENTFLAPHGLRLDPAQPPLLHFARWIDVVTWRPQRIA
jgi:uncharacterized protein